MNVKKISDLPVRELSPGVRLKALHLDRLTITFVEFDEGAVVPPHSHPHDQTSVVVSGKLLFTVEGEEKLVSEGEAVLIPGGVMHSAAAVAGPAVSYDSFSPKREDYE